MKLLAQNTDPHNDAQRSSSIDKYCTYENCDITFAELQDALTRHATITWVKHTHVPSEDALTFYEFRKDRTADSECVTAGQKAVYSNSIYSYGRMKILIQKAPIYHVVQKAILVRPPAA